jgi:pyridoxamine 5'-phosphate oxidase
VTTDFSVSTDPLERFVSWFEEAQACSAYADVVALATAGVDSTPSVRFVNFKGMRNGALMFYTNYGSRKAEQLAGNPVAAMAFHWPALRRQVTLEGACMRTSAENSERYFATRDQETQLTAWASDQSRPLDAFASFAMRIDELRIAYAGKAIPCPPHWGGYELLPSRIEFRVSGEHRRHRRWLYVRYDGKWGMVELYP